MLPRIMDGQLEVGLLSSPDGGGRNIQTQVIFNRIGQP
jgi:hypothetical protein